MSEQNLQIDPPPPFGITGSTQLSEVYQAWLQAEWPYHPGQRNEQREPSALSNYRRSLRAISFACGYEGDLNTASAFPLLADGEQIGICVDRGLHLEAKSKGKTEPKTQLIQNMQSNARAISKFALANYEENYQSGNSKRKQKKGRKVREGIPHLSWPLSLREDLERFQSWLGDTLPSYEADYRPKKLAPASIEGFKYKVGQYVKWRLENNLPTNHLYDLVNENEFTKFLSHYVNSGSENLGGYAAANASAICLAKFISYLVATEQIDPATGQITPELYRSNVKRTRSEHQLRLEECKLLKRVFYNYGKEILEDGELKNRLVRNSKVQGWTPKDLRDLRDQGFNTPPRRMANQTAERSQYFTRQRSATIFGISSETPLRIRTLTLITWDDMTKLQDGRWEILIPAEKLKIRRIKRKLNSYHMIYSLHTSRYIDEYRETLVEHFGENFESDVPNIFPTINGSTKRGKQGSTSALARTMTYLSLELRDTWFNPHSTRRIVATYVIRNLGAPGIMVAAKLLGDTPETVLQFYVDELGESSKEINQYFDLLENDTTP